MPAFLFRKSDIAPSAFNLEGAYTVTDSCLIDDEKTVKLQWELQGETGPPIHAQWLVGFRTNKNPEMVTTVTNGGKSFEGPKPFPNSELGILVASLDQAGFPSHVLTDDSPTEDDGTPSYADITKFKDFKFRFANKEVKNNYKEKDKDTGEYTGKIINGKRTVNYVVEILEMPKAAKDKKPASAKSGKSMAAEDDIDSLARTVVCRIAAAYKDAEGEPAPAPVTRLSGKISTVLGSKSAHFDDILALVADPEWIAENAEGHWTIKGGKLSLTKVGTDLVEAL